MDAKGAEDQEVYVGIRPEGFILDKNGKLSCSVSGIDVMGRDVSVVSTNENSLNPVVRSIISADEMGNISGNVVNFSLKQHKVFIFNKETEKRVYFGEQIAAHEAMVAKMTEDGEVYVTHNGPLPREADDKVKEKKAPEIKKNVFVKCFDFCKGLVLKIKNKINSGKNKTEDGAESESAETVADATEAVAISEEVNPTPVEEAKPEEVKTEEIITEEIKAGEVKAGEVKAAPKKTPARKPAKKPSTTDKTDNEG